MLIINDCPLLHTITLLPPCPLAWGLAGLKTLKTKMIKTPGYHIYCLYTVPRVLVVLGAQVKVFLCFRFWLKLWVLAFAIQPFGHTAHRSSFGSDLEIQSPRIQYCVTLPSVKSIWLHNFDIKMLCLAHTQGELNSLLLSQISKTWRTKDLIKPKMLLVLEHDNNLSFQESILCFYLQSLCISTRPPPRFIQRNCNQSWDLIKKFHIQPLTLEDVIKKVQTKHNILLFTMTMLKSIFKANNWNWRLDNLHFGMVSWFEVYNLFWLQKDADVNSNGGVWRMDNILTKHEHLSIAHTTVAQMLWETDPEGLSLVNQDTKSKGRFAFQDPSSDSQIKLERFGITVYI